ncbi:hypothetical protein TNCV_1382121 [Trichonephila clavipes]|nr:hypothetical protein TNCV_1382121 [Trichonephila clavipes]
MVQITWSVAKSPRVAEQSEVNNYSLTRKVHTFIELEAKLIFFVKMPAGWRSWFVTGLLHPRLRVRPRPEWVDFHDAENRQRPCSMIMRHEKEIP